MADRSPDRRHRDDDPDDEGAPLAHGDKPPARASASAAVADGNADADIDDRKRGKEKDRDRKKDKKERRGRSVGSRSRSRSRDRRRRSRSKEGRKSRDYSRSRSRDRHRKSRRDRSRSRDRDFRRRSRSRSWSPSRDKRRADVPAAAVPVAVGPGTGHDPYAALRQQPVAAVDPLEIQRMWQEQQLKARQLVLQQQAASAAQAASKTQREVYVGNLLPGALNDSMLTQIFNTALIVRFPGSNVPGMEPVIKASVNSSGKYAFVEFRTPEMATAALDLNGQVQFMGQAMSVNRPSGYVDPQKAAVAAAAASQALTAFQRGDPTALQAASNSGASLVGIAHTPALPQPVLPGAPLGGPLGAAGALTSAHVAQTVAAAMLPGPPAGAPPPGAMGAAGPVITPVASSTVICVTGMVTARVLADDAEYREVIEDMRDECGRHGTVLAVKVPRPPQPQLSAQLFGTGNFGKGFVQFADASAAEAARAAIHGRMFAGSQVQAMCIAPEAFPHI